jgi:multiple sugar transport system substrate-binding protein
MTEQHTPRPLSRRSFLRQAALGISLAALNACSNPFAPPPTPPPTPQPIAITLWSFLGGASETLRSGFDQAFPQITLTIEERSYDRSHQQLIESLASGSGAPDIFMTDLTFLGQIKAAGGLTNLADEPFNAAAFQHDIVAAAWEYGSLDGRQVVMPWLMGVGLGWYRPDIFAAAGLPSEPEQVQQAAATWQGWLALDSALRKANDQASILSSAIDLFNARAAQQGQGWIAGEQLRIDERGTPAAELVAAALKSNPELNQNSDGVMRRIVEGRLAGTVDGSWLRFFLQQDALQTAGQWRVIRAPGGDFLAGAIFLGIPQESAQKEAAWEFVRYMSATSAGQNETFKVSGAFPPYKPAWNDPIYQQPVEFFGGQSAYRIMAAAAENIPIGQVSPHDLTITQLIGRAIEDLVRNDRDPAEVMDETEAKVQAQIPALSR